MDLTAAIRLVCADLRRMEHLYDLDDFELIERATLDITEDEIARAFDQGEIDDETYDAYEVVWLTSSTRLAEEFAVEPAAAQ